MVTTPPNNPEGSNTNLARLSRYYLACLGYEAAGVSVQRKSKNTDYFVIDTPPQPNENLPSEPSQKLLGRQRTERGHYELYLGHLIAVVPNESSLEPILLFQLEESEDGGLKVDWSCPIINTKPFERFTNAEKDSIMSESIKLGDELGFANDNAQFNINEVAAKLKAIRPEWPWSATNGQSPDTRIYDGSIMFMAEKPWYTIGLENELKKLESLPPQNYANTALGAFLSGVPRTESKEISAPLLEVLPMNSEQRQAVKKALSQSLTIITGPPGTGKSQVVTNLLINAAWSGKNILFVSKNNKAVDVVETRINNLGSRPILIRVGKQQGHHAELTEYMNKIFSGNAPADAQTFKREFDGAKEIYENTLVEFSSLKKQEGKFIELGKKTDALERDSEDARKILGEEIFSNALQIDAAKIEDTICKIATAASKADEKPTSFFQGIFWRFFKNHRLKKLAGAISESPECLKEIGVAFPECAPQDLNIPKIKNKVDVAFLRNAHLKKSIAYQKALKELKALSLEEISNKELGLLKKMVSHSEDLWNLWLRRPLSEQKRKTLSEFMALLQMVSAPSGVSGNIWKRYYKKMDQISDLAPCWAVTSLSAHKRIPFSPGMFDIVIFDEASQCDIASALPLLYRAKSAVIIGDLKQLSHISRLPREQDNAFLEKYGLLENFADWAYSYQSLFMLGTGKADSINNLVEHHRSHHDIINFANKEFYGGALRIATKYSGLRFIESEAAIQQGVEWINVKGNVERPSSGSAQNTLEAKKIVEVLRDLIVRKNYEGSIGIVTPFRAQSNLIAKIIRKNAEFDSAFDDGRILVDTVHKFQGDERDIMIFSPVVSAGLLAGASNFLRYNGNIFNVAITRARARLIAVGDLDACVNSGIGYLANFADYVSSLEQRQRAANSVQLQDIGASYPEAAENDIEVSDWEKKFYVAAYAAGFRLIPQYRIEQYSVDFVMFDGDRKLVIEVDGERYHRNWTGELCRRDQLRNQRLFELGYEVFRFWVYEIRDDLEGCFEKMREWQSQG